MNYATDARSSKHSLANQIMRIKWPNYWGDQFTQLLNDISANDKKIASLEEISSALSERVEKVDKESKVR